MKMTLIEIVNEKIGNWHTIGEGQEFVLKLMNEIKNNPDLLKKARLKDKNYPFKKIVDEYIPLQLFAELYCKDANVLIRHTGEKTQTAEKKYDGELLYPDGTTITVEITKPYNGYLHHKNAEKINERGYSKVYVRDCIEHTEQIVSTILKTASEKAKKNYRDSIIVFYIPDLNCFRDLNEKIHHDLNKNVFDSMTALKFNAKEIYILIPRYNSSTSVNNSKLILIPQKWH